MSDSTAAPAAAASSSNQPEMMQAFQYKAHAEPTPESKEKGILSVGPFPKPVITVPTDLLVRVHAASINPIDFKTMRGNLAMILKEGFPSPLGYDVSGVVESIGSGVTKFKVGDAIVSRVPYRLRGTFAEYVVAPEEGTTLKPKNLTHVEASCIPLAGQTALQALRKLGVQDQPAPRTLFVPAALGGVGALAIQIARHHFHVEKILSTVSTSKLDRATELVGGADLELIDYKKSNPVTGREGTVDFVFDTTGEAAAYMPLLKVVEPPGRQSQIVSIATLPNGEQAAGFGATAPWLVRQVLNFKDWRLRCKASSYKSNYSYLLLSGNAPDLQILVDLAEAGHLKPIVGQVFPLSDSVEALRAASDGSVAGKVVIAVIPEEEQQQQPEQKQQDQPQEPQA